MISEAFVLGAGLGTRLKALTQHRPKPLIPVANRPLITYAFDHLHSAGVNSFLVNTHWRAEVYGRIFPKPDYAGTPIHFQHEWPEVLETAGGIKNVEGFLHGETFWVYNGDILSTLPLAPAWRAHHDAGNEVTLVLRSKDGPLQIAFEERTGRILDIGHRLDPTVEPRFLFTGIYLVNRAFLQRIPPGKKESVVPIFCDMIRTGARLGGVVIDEGGWFDLGTREQYLAVHHSLGSSPWIDPSALVDPSATITGPSAIGPNARIGAGARIHDSIIWEDAEVASDAELSNSIVVTGQRAEGRLDGIDVA